MAIDNTPPRLKLIVTIGVITLVTLGSLEVVFKSYYVYMSDQAHRGKVAKPLELESYRKDVATALTNTQVPVDKAIADLAGGARPDAIRPKQSDDTNALAGWSKLPKPIPRPDVGPLGRFVDAGTLAVDADGWTSAMTDAGVPATADAGAAMPLSIDAGTPAPAPTPHSLAVSKDAGH